MSVAEEKENPPTFALATEIDRAIDLSRRACGAVAMNAGLGFPVGTSAPLRFAPGTSNSMSSLTTYFQHDRDCHVDGWPAYGPHPQGHQAQQQETT